MTSDGKSSATEKESDKLLWLAAALVVGIGLVWLVISQPWSSSSSAPVATQAGAAEAARISERAAGSAAAAASDAPATADRRVGGLDDPLRMAELAYDAGMLVEPEDYSAWALFGKALEAEPDNGAALEGLNRVADDLVRRGSSAVEQGRFDDAKGTAALITAKLPEHAGARALVARIDELTPDPNPEPRVTAPPPPEMTRAPTPARATATAPVRVETPAPEPAAAPAIDPIETMHDAFRAAMAANRLLTPANDSARHHVERMLDAQPDHTRTRSARDLLVTEMLARSAQAVEALDPDAARTWIDEAERLADDRAPVEAARVRLNGALIAIETAKRLPASELTVLDYVAPTYPRNALHREIEGWVDVEFTVAPDGTTQNIAVTDGSHNTYFRDEAVAQWRFEPRIFLDRPIAQHTYTRLRFVLGDE